MKSRILFVSAALAALVGVPQVANAAITFDISQSGSNVQIIGGGSFDTTGLTVLNNNVTQAQAGVVGANAQVTTGAINSAIIQYSGLSGPVSFGTGGFFTTATSSGNAFGIAGRPGVLVLPNGYVSGSALANTATFANTTLAGLGLNVGSYLFTAGADTVRVNIGVAAVPELATWAMMIVGFGFVGASLRQRRQRTTVRFA